MSGGTHDAGRGRQAMAFTLGAMVPEIVGWLRRQKEISIANAAVTITRGELSHGTRPAKADRGAALDIPDLDRLPDIIARPDAVLYNAERTGELLYVFKPAADPERKGKVVVRVNYTTKLALDGEERTGVTTNSVRSAGYVQPENLRDPRFERIRGSVE